MKNDIQNDIQLILTDTLRETGLLPAGFDSSWLEFSRDGNFGDISLNIALKLSRQFKDSPRAIAGRIVPVLTEKISRSSIAESIQEIKIEGAGFINFYFSNKFFHEQLACMVSETADYGRLDLGKKKKVLVEFVSANPTGPLSVAHARQAAVGDALANILSFLGFDVTREYYLNDEGNQINILGNSIKTRLQQLEGEPVEFPENYYQGEYIIDLAKAVKEGRATVTDFSDYGVKEILATIEQELKDFKVFFDSWYSQKALREAGKIEKAFEIIKEYLYREEGALWFKSTQFGDDKDRVVIKSDGSYTYLAPDIAYHYDKFKRGYEWLINLWGPDHHGYINRLKASIQAMGQPADSLAVVIVQLASISREGKPVEMSTRRGQYISLREVLTEVGSDAARFFFIMRRTSSHLSFDLEIAKKQTSENPVYYIQYAYARIGSILRQSGTDIDFRDFRGCDGSQLTEKEEID
ncbi:MAG: arginine--tRNA ligase, partial [Candidatus Omnitrophica bacterium]|nr:arginine--tRNA ligase [Candidatus Omnitrophota bacterium]